MRKCSQCGYIASGNGEEFCPMCGSRFGDIEDTGMDVFSNQNRKPYDNMNRIKTSAYANARSLNIRLIAFFVIMVIVLYSAFSYSKSDKRICRAAVHTMFKEIEEKEKQIAVDYIGSALTDEYAAGFVDAINAGLSYKIKKVSVYGNKAKVIVAVTNAELASNVESMVSSLQDFNLSGLRNALFALADNRKSSKALDRIIETIKEERKDCRKVKTTGEINLEKVDGYWEVTWVDSDVIRGFIGVESVDNIISEYIGGIIYGDDYYNDYDYNDNYDDYDDYNEDDYGEYDYDDYDYDEDDYDYDEDYGYY